MCARVLETRRVPHVMRSAHVRVAEPLYTTSRNCGLRFCLSSNVPFVPALAPSRKSGGILLQAARTPLLARVSRSQFMLHTKCPWDW